MCATSAGFFPPIDSPPCIESHVYHEGGFWPRDWSTPPFDGFHPTLGVALDRRWTVRVGVGLPKGGWVRSIDTCRVDSEERDRGPLQPTPACHRVVEEEGTDGVWAMAAHAVRSPQRQWNSTCAAMDRVLMLVLVLSTIALWTCFEKTHRERVEVAQEHWKKITQAQRNGLPKAKRKEFRKVFVHVDRCIDEIPECKVMSNNRMCSMPFVRDTCKVSCDVCDPTRSDALASAEASKEVTLCYDLNDSCQALSEEPSFCESEEAELRCKESCGLC